MTLGNEFNENRNIITGHGDLEISIAAFNTFAASHGSEMATGYLLALKDMMKHLDEILNRYHHSGGSMAETAHMVRIKTKMCHDRLSEFLGGFDSSGENQRMSPPNSLQDGPI